MTQAYPPMKQFVHDSFYTTLGSIIAGLMEILLCHKWATGELSYSHLSRYAWLEMIYDIWILIK